MISKIFAGEQLHQYFDKNYLEIENIIQLEEDELFLGLDKDQYIDELVDKYSIPIPIINFNGIELGISTNEVYDGVEGISLLPKSRTQDVVVYKIPYEWDESFRELLNFASTRSENEMSDLEIKDGYICFYINKTSEEEMIIKQKHYITDLKADYKIFINQIEEYDAGLRNSIELFFDVRKEKISSDNEFLDSLKRNL
ncbi:MAG: hypothetical protein ACLPWD_03985 [Methanobacterium sp.]